jgi:hypothetical protein
VQVDGDTCSSCCIYSGGGNGGEKAFAFGIVDAAAVAAPLNDNNTSA